MAAAALGFARRALDETLKHTSTRQLFGATLSALQMTEASVADMATEIDASALLVYRSAWAKDCHQERVTREAAMAKLYEGASEIQKVIIARQTYGGMNA